MQAKFSVVWCSLADQLLTNLWRWLCSPASALASPALHQAVAGLMRKCLAQVGTLLHLHTEAK